MFSADGNELLYYVDAGEKTLNAFHLEHRSHRTIASSQYAWEILPSPDNKWIAFRELF
jgi:hypothetical protein